MNAFAVGVNSPGLPTGSQLRHLAALASAFNLPVAYAGRIRDHFIIIEDIEHPRLQAVHPFIDRRQSLLINNEQEKRRKKQRD